MTSDNKRFTHNMSKGECEGNPLAKQKAGIKENLTIFFFKLQFYA